MKFDPWFAQWVDLFLNSCTLFDIYKISWEGEDLYTHLLEIYIVC